MLRIPIQVELDCEDCFRLLLIVSWTLNTRVLLVLLCLISKRVLLNYVLIILIFISLILQDIPMHLDGTVRSVIRTKIYRGRIFNAPFLLIF